MLFLWVFSDRVLKSFRSFSGRCIRIDRPQVSELPLKNFYRLVLGPASGSVASFESLPRRDTLTQRLDTPEPWNVQASAALQDLDNLR